ncbi:uncharacterized protein DUF3604 [Christiangramia gaetbulicola]|uniref:Uncharacterized protein DUF3604 n=1 Tax=Christiangramia gaetbulicola TaxID=703340 RepID=A0A2T6AM32_9FLAO|nr:DUF3604 domain-containing protein [Christiangramia gaetbulicola]PTX44865.1 uncharacterized protein DUF3604 [Christiangramia gaetbulicola]
MKNLFRSLGILLSLCLFWSCGDEKKENAENETASNNMESEQIERNPLKEAYFGDTHVHTGWSFDAGLDGATLTPTDAYRYAIGEEVTSNSGIKTQLSRPYDWFMITDHSDGMGTINEVIDGNPEMMESEVLQRWNEAFASGSEEAAGDAKSEVINLQSNGQLPDQIMDPKWMETAWNKTIDAAEQFYRPGEFTTFTAYEWTVNAGGGDNLHRNIIYKEGGDQARDILPFTTFESEDAKKLWEWMANYEAKTGDKLLAIPHNGNMSNGRMYEEQQFDGSPMTKEWAQMRQKYERLMELFQYKGQSEAHPFLSPEDEFADYELWDRGNLVLKPKESKETWKYEYWREGLKSGMRIKQELGVNPFMYGSNSATDTHTGISSVEEDEFYGKFKTVEPSNKERWNFPLISGNNDAYKGWEMAASGIMGVWAESNTREDIWEAMYRRETFSTTGPRMKIRFFGGFDYTEEDKNDLAKNGYDKGVAMGAMLGAAQNDKAPTFLIQAMKDPEGANLDRVQVIKGWVDANGETQEKIYQVAWSGDRKLDNSGKLPAVGNTVDMETAEYTNDIGDTEFTTYWTDPDFDSALPAFYYVRVLEIPTPRWTLYDKIRHDLDLPDEVPLVHQERGVSSPIWYNPE